MDVLAAIREDCQDPPSWRLYSRERWPGGTLRSWRTLAPVAEATGPLDPVIPVLPITPDVLALGYCAPWEPPERPPDDAAVHVWMLVAGRPPADLLAPVVLAVRSASRTLRPPLGALIAPPAAGTGPGAGAGTSPGVGATGAAPRDAWPAGTYVFAVQGTGFARWWAVRIPELDPLAASASVSPVP